MTIPAKKLTEAQKRVQKRLLSIVSKRTAQDKGWKMPKSYNKNWNHALQNSLERKLVRMVKGLVWFVKKSK